MAPYRPLLAASRVLPPLLLALSAASPCAENIDVQQFRGEVTQFLSREVSAHVAAIRGLDPPPATMFGVRTGGDFSWGTFMRAVMEYSAYSGEDTIADREVAPFLGKVGLIEAQGGGKTFSQLYAALTLRHFGTDLKTNRLWQSLTPAEQTQWRSLLDPGRFYDRQARHVINLPENYFGVAARIAAIDYQLGITGDRAFLDDILDRAAGQFLQGARYTDDDVPHGRYDRYSQEYARFVYEVAADIGRQDIMEAVAPALTTDMQTWWALVSSDGYSFPWGRTIGAVSYLDTMDIVGFLARYPRFRPATLPELASVYHAAWEWLKHDDQPDRHLLNIWGFGRGNYHYIVDREWQQTTQFLGKAANSFALLRGAMEREGVTSFAATPQLPQVARFDWFHQGDRPAGVWLVRAGRLRFALPFTTGTESGMADYLPAPHGLPGFAAPVAQKVPALVPYLELADGRMIVAGDGADRIEPDRSGKSVRAVWKRWVVAGAPPAQFADLGLQSEVAWSVEGDALVRSETITASRPVPIRGLSVIYPSTGDRASTRFESGRRVDRFETPEGTVEVRIASPDIPFALSLMASGDQPIGKGPRGAIPLILRMDAKGLTLGAGQSFHWTLRYEVLGK